MPHSEPPGREIERKFLVRTPPENLRDCPAHDLLQGYLVITEDRTEVRLRKKDDRYYQTIKTGGGRERLEREIELSRAQFEALWPLTAGRRIEKTRHEIPCGAHTIELDVYRGALSGLITAEVEFKTPQSADQFAPPHWFDRELTDDPRYKNAALACFGLPDNPL